MTTKPELRLGGNLLPGLAAVALFGVMAAIFLGSSFGEPAGFPQEVSITAGLGYALFDIGAGSQLESEGFLAAFEIIDFVLIAALAGAVMLAKREGGGFITDVRTDGGRKPAGSRSDRTAKRSGRGRESVSDGGKDGGDDR